MGVWLRPHAVASGRVRAACLELIDTECLLSMYGVSNNDVAYSTHVPKLWNQTIEAQRREVRDAVLDTTAALVSANGLRSVTMSQIAEQTGIGRATLYKYFPDVDTIVRALHEREISRHLAHLANVRD